MDFPNLWKEASIVLTGAFGILGLLKDFKNKSTGKVTLWGYVSLAGIVLSTILGLSAQLIQARTESQKSIEEAHRAEDAALQTQRLLSSVKHVKLRIAFKLPCQDQSFTVLCQGIPAHDYLLSESEKTALYRRLWSTIRSGNSKTGVDVTGTVTVIKDEEKAKEYAKSGFKTPDPDLGFLVVANSLSTDARLGLEHETLENRQIVPVFTVYMDDQATNSGVIKSSLDLQGCFIYFLYRSPLPAYPADKFQPVRIDLIMDNGQVISTYHFDVKEIPDGAIAVGIIEHAK
jgi:hypothetical protein